MFGYSLHTITTLFLLLCKRKMRNRMYHFHELNPSTPSNSRKPKLINPAKAPPNALEIGIVPKNMTCSVRRQMIPITRYNANMQI